MLAPKKEKRNSLPHPAYLFFQGRQGGGTIFEPEVLKKASET